MKTCIFEKKNLNSTSRIRIAVFASGGGSNAAKILAYFHAHPQIEVSVLLSNNTQSGVFALADQYLLPALHINKDCYRSGAEILRLLKAHKVDLIALAGYLKKIPASVIDAYPRHIVNIHPSLLPAFGGKGMYGMNVHKAVISSGVDYSGITIHYVDNIYDHGEVIFQERISVDPAWNAEELQQAVLKLEHLHYARIIEKVASGIPFKAK